MSSGSCRLCLTADTAIVDRPRTPVLRTDADLALARIGSVCTWALKGLLRRDFGLHGWTAMTTIVLGAFGEGLKKRFGGSCELTPLFRLGVGEVSSQRAPMDPFDPLLCLLPQRLHVALWYVHKRFQKSGQIVGLLLQGRP